MAELSASEFAKQILGAVKESKPYDKKGADQFGQLKSMLEKTTASFAENFKKIESYMKSLITASSTNKADKSKESKLLDMQVDAYRGQKLKKYYEKGLKFFEQGMKKGSIYVHDVTSHKLLNSINTQMSGADPFAGIGAALFTPEFYSKIEEAIGEGAKKTLTPEPSASTDTGKSDASDVIAESEKASAEQMLLDETRSQYQLQRLGKLQDLVGSIEGAIFGLGDKAKNLPELLFGGLIRAEVAFVSTAADAAFELGNVTKETKSLLAATEKVELSVSQTGMDRDDFQQNYLKNLKSGIRNQKEAQKIAISQLNTEKQLGFAAGDLNETFRDFALSGRMSQGQIADLGRGMREVAKNTGLTGEALKSAVQSSKAFTDNLKKAAQLTSTASKNVIEATANFQKLGVAEAGGELLKKLTSSTDLLMDSTSKASTFLFMAAGSAGKIGELQKGTLLRTKQGIKDLAAGMENVLKQFGVDSLDAIDQLNDEAKFKLNFQLKTTFGMELGEIRSVIEGIKETGKTFGDRLTDVQKKLAKNITSEEKLAILEEERRLKTSKSLEVLTALDEAAKGAKDMNQALATFGKRKGDFKSDIEALGGTFVDGIDAARTSINTSVKSINEGLMKAGKQQIQIDTSEIEKALQDPTALRELTAKITKGEQELATAQKSQLDPVKQTEQTLKEYNDYFRSWSQSSIVAMMSIFGAIGAGTVATLSIGTMLVLKLADIQRTLSQFTKRDKNAPGMMESFFGKIFGGKKEDAAAAPVRSSAAEATNSAANAANSVKTPTLQGIGNTMLTNAAQITAILGPLLLLIAATTLLVAIMIKKFDLKPADIMYASIGLGILLLAAGGIMFALMQGEKESEKQTGGKMFSIKGIAKLAAMGLIFTFAAGAIVSLIGGIFAIVQGVLKSIKFQPGDGLKTAQGLGSLFMVSGALFGALVGLFQVVENATSLFGANIAKNIGFMVLIGLGLYLFGGAIVQFMAGMVTFTKSVLDSMQMDVGQILEVAKKLAAMALVLGVVAGVMLAFAGAVKLMSMMLPQVTLTISLAPIASLSLLQFAGIVGLLAIGLLAFGLIGYLFGPEIIKNVAIGAGAVAVMSIALLLIALSIVGFAVGISALASMVGTMEIGVALAPLASYELLVFAAVVAILAVGMMAFAYMITAAQIDPVAIMKAVFLVMVIMLAAALIATTLMLGLYGIMMLAAQAVAIGAAQAVIPYVAFALIGLAVVMGLLMLGMALLVDVVSNSAIRLEDIVYTSLVITALALGVGLIGVAVGFGVLGLIALGGAAGPFMAAALNAGIGLLMIAGGVALLSLGIAALYAASLLLTPSILFKVITVFALLTIALVTVAIGAAISTYALIGIFTAGVLFLAASMVGYLGLHAISLGLWWVNSGITEKNKISGKSLETVTDETLDKLYVLDYLVEVMGELAVSFLALIPPLIIVTVSSALVGVWGILFGIAAIVAFLGLVATAVGLVLVNTGLYLIQTPVENLYAKIDFLLKTVPATFAALAVGFQMMAAGLVVISSALTVAAAAGVALSVAGFVAIIPIVAAVGWIGMLVTSLGYAIWASGLEKKADDLKRWSGLFADVAKIMIYMSAALISFSYAMTAFGIAMFFLGGSSIRKNEKTGEETTVIGIILADIFNSLEMMISKLEKIDLDPAELKKIAEKTQIVGEMMKVMSSVIQTFASSVLPLFQRSIFTLYMQKSTIDQIVDAKKDIEDKLPKAFTVMVSIGEQFAEAVADMGPAINNVDKAKKLGELSKALGEMMTGFANNLPYIRKGAENLINQSQGKGILWDYTPVQTTLADGIDAMKLILNTIAPKIQSLYVDESLSKKLNIASSVLGDLMKSFEALAKVVDMFTAGWISSGALVEFATNKDKYNTDLKNALDAIVMILTSANTAVSGMRNFDALPKKISVMGEATKNMGKALEAFQSNAKIFTSKKLAKDFERIKGDASNPETNVAKNFLDFVFMSFVKPIMDQNVNPAKVNKALEVVAGSAKATEAMASVLDKFGKDFGRLFESKNIKQINAMISEVTKDADIGNLGKFISDFMTFIDKNIIAEINKVDFDNILNSQDILAELPKVIDGLVALFRSFGELVRFAQSKELKGAKKDQKTSLDVLKSWTSGKEGQELGKAIADFMLFANNQLLAPIVGVLGNVDLDTMMDASDAMKTISDVIVNLQRAMVSFGELGSMLTKQKGTGKNATTYAKELQQFMKDLQTPEAGKTLGMIPSFFDFITKNLLAPLVELDSKSEIGPDELKTAAETLDLIPRVISGVSNMMTTFDQTFSKIDTSGGKNTKALADFIPNALKSAKAIESNEKGIADLFKTISKTMVDPIFDSNLPPGDVKEAGDAYDALIEMMPKFANFLMEAEANLAGINFAGVQAIFDNMSSIATVENSGLVDTFLAANDYLTELVGTMEGTLEKMTRVMELNSQINDMSAQISATSVNVGTPAGAQVGAVPTTPTSATAPLNPSVNATVNNTAVTTGSSNVEEANSAAIASKLSEAVNILNNLLSVTVADSGSGLSGTSGLKKPTAASGFEGGAGSGLGGSSDVTSL
jgi:hypothetical protein